MKLPTNYKPQFVCFKDDTRYILKNGYYKDGIAYATNGNSLVAALVEKSKSDQSEEGFLPVEALKVATKKRVKHHPHQGLIEMQDHGTTKVFPSKGVTTLFEKPCEGTYPFIGKVIPSHAKPKSISLNAKLLFELSQALGSNEMIITFDETDDKACLIVTTRDVDRFGLLMPRNLDGLSLSNEALKKAKHLTEKPTPPII